MPYTIMLQYLRIHVGQDFGAVSHQELAAFHGGGAEAHEGPVSGSLHVGGLLDSHEKREVLMMGESHRFHEGEDIEWTKKECQNVT